MSETLPTGSHIDLGLQLWGAVVILEWGESQKEEQPRRVWVGVMSEGKGSSLGFGVRWFIVTLWHLAALLWLPLNARSSWAAFVWDGCAAPIPWAQIVCLSSWLLLDRGAGVLQQMFLKALRDLIKMNCVNRAQLIITQSWRHLLRKPAVPVRSPRPAPERTLDILKTASNDCQMLIDTLLTSNCCFFSPKIYTDRGHG